MEAARTSETLVNFYQTTRCYNPEDSNLHTHRRENLKSYCSWYVPHKNLINSWMIQCFSKWIRLYLMFQCSYNKMTCYMQRNTFVHLLAAAILNLKWCHYCYWYYIPWYAQVVVMAPAEGRLSWPCTLPTGWGTTTFTWLWEYFSIFSCLKVGQGMGDQHLGRQDPQTCHLLTFFWGFVKYCIYRPPMSQSLPERGQITDATAQVDTMLQHTWE
jgi:hypothetical protein